MENGSLSHEFTDAVAKLAQIHAEFDNHEGTALIRALYQNYGAQVAAITSFGANAPLLLAQIAEIDQSIPIYTADTGSYLSPAIKHNRDALTQRLGLENIRIMQVPEEEMARLEQRQCCGDFKRAALNEGLIADGRRIVIAGLNSAEQRDRHGVQKCALSDDGRRVIVNPNATDNQEAIDAELRILGLGDFAGGTRTPTCGPCHAPFCGLWRDGIASGPAGR